MKRIFVPASQPEDWQQFLADPDRQWKIGYSARTLAYGWHSTNGFPKEVNHILASSESGFIESLLYLPEYKIPLKDLGSTSQNDYSSGSTLLFSTCH